jgi:hypothetical protein
VADSGSPLTPASGGIASLPPKGLASQRPRPRKRGSERGARYARNFLGIERRPLSL